MKTRNFSRGVRCSGNLSCPRTRESVACSIVNEQTTVLRILRVVRRFMTTALCTFCSGNRYHCSNVFGNARSIQLGGSAEIRSGKTPQRQNYSVSRIFTIYARSKKLYWCVTWFWSLNNTFSFVSFNSGGFFSFVGWSEHREFLSNWQFYFLCNNCWFAVLGQRFAGLSTTLTLASLIQQFEFQVPDDYVMEPKVNGPMQSPKNGLPLFVKVREWVFWKDRGKTCLEWYFSPLFIVFFLLKLIRLNSHWLKTVKFIKMCAFLLFLLFLSTVHSCPLSPLSHCLAHVCRTVCRTVYRRADYL